MPLTVLICAIWLVICALSIGLSGSWFCSCVASSFRKALALPTAVLPDPSELADEVALPALVVALRAANGSVLATVLVMGALVGSQPWPSCRVLGNRLLAVFITSMLFWYEREAEIMSTISSTGLTLL